MRLSVSDIGGIALKSFCQRCFWLKKKTKNQLPYRVPPPGIFANIENYMKKVVDIRIMNPGQQLPLENHEKVSSIQGWGDRKQLILPDIKEDLFHFPLTRLHLPRKD